LGPSTYTGGITAERDVFATAAVAPGATPELILGMRPAIGLSEVEFAGTHHCAFITAQDGGGRDATYFRCAFDDQGEWVVDGPSLVSKSNGVLVTGSPNQGGWYDVDARGGFSFGNTELIGQGSVLTGGDLAIVGGDTQAPGFASYLIALRVGSGLSNATLSGAYRVVGLAFRTPTTAGPGAPAYRDWTAFSGRVLADGLGLLQWQDVTENAEGIVTTTSGSDDYAVASDGTLTARGLPPLGSGPLLRGAVSRDGRFAFLVGELATDQPVFFAFLVRA
jgi:hypothetical protein